MEMYSVATEPTDAIKQFVAKRPWFSYFSLFSSRSRPTYAFIAGTIVAGRH